MGVGRLRQSGAYRRVAGMIATVTMISGCTHALEITNMGLYKPMFIQSQNNSVSVGLSAVTTGPEEERLVMAVANAMKRDGFKVTYPYYPNEGNRNSVDYVVKLTTNGEYKGSGWNFLINWPGFLIWTPAWHGYNYGVLYDFDADITEVASGRTLPRLSSPIDLAIRHADMGRTWTEISWLEWSVIAFAGGILFTRYDYDITPAVLDASENKIGDYVASKIGAALIAAENNMVGEKEASLRPFKVTARM